MDLPARASIREVGPRDGLQDWKAFVPTETKVAFIRRVEAAGLLHVNTTSFVSPKWVPQMADAEAVMAALAPNPAVERSVTVPNEEGLRRALAAGADAVGFPASASETFQRKNVNATMAETFARIRALAEVAHAAGKRVGASVSMAFGCPFEGDVPLERVVETALALEEAGCDAIAVADTIGVANPRQVRDVFGAVLPALRRAEVIAHFHDARGFGLANAAAALQAGCTRFDASVGGLGGCPYAAGAPGNLATEDLVHLFEEMGVSTGVDLDALIETARWLEGALGAPLRGQVARAGKVPHRPIA